MEDFLLFFSKSHIIFWILIIFNTSIIFFQKPEKIIMFTILSNIVFLLYILSATLIERFTWFPDLELADNLGFVSIFLDVLIYNSNRFIYTSIFILTDVLILLKMFKYINKDLDSAAH